MMVSGQLFLTAGRLCLKYEVHQATEATVDCPKRKLHNRRALEYSGQGL